MEAPRDHAQPLPLRVTEHDMGFSMALFPPLHGPPQRDIAGVEPLHERVIRLPGRVLRKSLQHGHVRLRSVRDIIAGKEHASTA